MRTTLKTSKPPTVSSIAKHKYGIHLHCEACGFSRWYSPEMVTGLGPPDMPIHDALKRRRCPVESCKSKSVDLRLSSPHIVMRGTWGGSPLQG